MAVWNMAAGVVEGKAAKNSIKSAANYENKKASDLHECICKRIKKFAKIADFIVLARRHAVKQICKLGNDINKHKHGHSPARPALKPRRNQIRQ